MFQTHGLTSFFSMHTDKYQWLRDVSFSPGDFKDHAAKPTTTIGATDPQQKAEPQAPQASPPSSREVFSCPREGCVRVFQRYSNLEKHLSFEKCCKYVERLTLMDLAKIEYASRLQKGIGQRPVFQSKLLESAKEDPVSGAKEGWALRESKKSNRFKETQKEYLLQKFNIGQSTGKKAQAEVVAKDMRRAKGSDGKRLFSVAEFLSPQQIASYFLRLASKAKKGLLSQEDIHAMEEEANFDNARQDIFSALQGKHPIVLDQYNICELTRSGELKKMKLGLLQHICESFDLDVPPNKPRKKAPYVTLIEELVSSCSCTTGS